MSMKQARCFGYRQAMFGMNNRLILRTYCYPTFSHRGNFLLPNFRMASQKQKQFTHDRATLARSFKSIPRTLVTQSGDASSSAPSSQSNQHDNPSWYDELKFIMLLLQRLMMGLGIVHCFKNYVMDITLCSGPSMLPTINESDEIILIDRFTILRGSIQDGTTISSRTQAAILRLEQERFSLGVPSSNMWNAIRMGVGGSIDDQKQSSTHGMGIFTTWRIIIEHMISPISVGDVVISQNPNRPGTICKRILGLPGDHVVVLNGSGGTNIQIVPDYHVWLEGDNANNSLDSRQSGPIPLALLRGRAVARIWPLRGHAYLKRTVSPATTRVYTDAGSSQCSSNSIVIPAGYSRQHIFGPMQKDQQSIDRTIGKN